MMVRALWDMITRDDGTTPDFLLLGTFGLMMTAVLCTLWRVFHAGDAFDAYGFLIGAGALVGGCGLGQRARDGSPPGRPPPPLEPRP